MSKIDRKLYDAVKKNKVCNVTNTSAPPHHLAAVFVSLLVWVLKYHTCLASGRDLPHLFCMQKCLPKYAEVFLVPLHVYGDVYKYTALPTLILKPLHDVPCQ